MQHEIFCHIIFSLNFFSFYSDIIDKKSDEKEKDNLQYSAAQINPKNYYKYQEEEIIEILKAKKVKDKIITMGESGISFTTFITRGKYKLMRLLGKRGIDFKYLFEHSELMAAEDLSNYISELEKIYINYGFSDANDNIEYKSRFFDSEKQQGESLGIPTLEKY